MFHMKPICEEYIDRLLNSPRALRYRLPHLHDRAKQDLAAKDTLAHQRTMLEIARVEQEIARHDEILEKAAQAGDNQKCA